MPSPIPAVPAPSPIDPSQFILPPGMSMPSAPTAPPVPTPSAAAPFYMATPPPPPAPSGVPMFLNEPVAPQRPAPRMFGGGGGSMQNLTPRGIPRPMAQRAQQMQRAVVSEVGSPITSGPKAGGSAGGSNFRPGIKSSMKVGPTNPNPFPKMTGTPSRPSAGSFAKGAAKGAFRALGPFAAGQIMSGLGDEFDSSTLRAMGLGTSFGGGTAAMLGAPALPAVAVPAAGIGLAGALAKPVTGRTQQWAEWMEDPTDFDKLSFGAGDSLPGQAWDVAMDLSSAPLAGLMAGGSKLLTSLTGGDTSDPNDNPALRGERDFSSLGLGLDGGGSEAEAVAARQAQVAEARAALPTMMADLGIEEATMATALDQLEQDIALMRIQAEHGLLPRTDENGKPIEGEFISPDEVESIALANFIQSTLPEVIDIDRQRQDALARAAGFQAVLGNQMQPFADEQRAMAEMVPSAVSNPYLPPEMVGPMRAMGEAQRSGMLQQANAWQAAGQMIPAMAAMDQQQALQRQIDQLLMQQMLQGARDGGGESEADAILGG